MKRIDLKLLLALFFILNSANMKGQILNAGLQGNYYHDIVPDSTFAFAACNTCFFNSRCDIDIDNDGMPDFEIKALGSGSLGGQSCSVKITAYNNNQVAISRYDSAFSFGVFQYSVPVAKAFNYNDAIDGMLNYESSGCLTSRNYGFGTGATIYEWDTLGERYAGVKVVTLNDTIYGWIRMEIITGAAFYNLVIKDFSSLPVSTSINENILNEGFNLYPLPFSHDLIVEYYSESPNQNVTVKLFDLFGRVALNKLLPQKSILGKNSIVLSDISLKSGLYVLNLMEGGTEKIKLRIMKMD